MFCQMYSEGGKEERDRWPPLLVDASAEVLPGDLAERPGVVLPESGVLTISVPFTGDANLVLLLCLVVV